MRAAVLVSNEPSWALELARTWAVAGDDVTVVLLDAAAGVARAGAAAAAQVRAAADAGVVVLVGEDAAQRRGIVASALVDGVKVADLDEIADLVAESAERVVWL